MKIPKPSSPLAIVGITGGLVGALLIGQRLSADPPEVGPLEPVLAAPAERLEVVSLARGETFGEVLEAANIGWSEQNTLLLAFREQANPRRMSEGTPITFRWFPKGNDLRGIDVALDGDETVRLQRDGAGWSSNLVYTPITVDTLYIAGTIEDLLWNSITDHTGLTEELSWEARTLIVDWMDKVFQWQIDFSRQVKAGDTYRFAMERHSRPNGTMKMVSHLIAAEYVNQGTPYRAVWFDPNDDGDGTFYDEDGKSVRRAFLMKPIPLSRISSSYSSARLHPVLNTVRAHRGVDFAAPTGTPIQATSDGVVIYADRKGDLGNLVEIRAPNGWVSRYGHMSQYQDGVRVGSRVKQGQTIGYVGMTGLATGPHCHYELRRNGQALDPLSIKLPAGDPVPTTAWGRWALESEERLGMLSNLPGPPILRQAEDSDPDSTDPGSEAGGV